MYLELSWQLMGYSSGQVIAVCQHINTRIQLPYAVFLELFYLIYFFHRVLVFHVSGVF